MTERLDAGGRCGRIRPTSEAALGRLAPDDQEVLVLRHLEQLSTREIAAILEISEPAVRYRQRKAMERLTRLLSDDAAEAESE